jgi:hypothetical protein
MSGFDLIIKQDEDDTEAAEVLVDGTLGAHKYRFLLDTGAAKTCVTLDDYTSTFDCIDKSNSSGVFAKSSDDLVKVPTIDLGPIVKKNITVGRRAVEGSGTSSLIGMDILKDYCCHFLFDENRVSINPGDGGYNFQELSYDNKFHPYIDIHFGELKAQTVWDTGAGITVADMNFIKKHPAHFEEVGRSYGTDSTGYKMETPMFIMAATMIGDNEFPPHKVAGVDLSQVNDTIELPMDLILGYSTLSKANWLFDFPRKKWAITKLLDAT